MRSWRRSFAFALALTIVAPVSPSGASGHELAAVPRDLVAEALESAPERGVLGQAEADLDRLAGREATLWTRILASMPPPSVASEQVERERRLRAGLMPVLAARRAAYREAEADAEARLRVRGPEPGRLAPDDATVDAAMRLLAYRQWAEATAGLAREAQRTLDGLHATFLLRWGKALAALPRELRLELADAETARRKAEIAHDAALEAIETLREPVRRAARERELRAAADVARAAADVESLAAELTDPSRRSPGRDAAHERLVAGVAARTRASAALAADWAARRAGVAWLGHESFLLAAASPAADFELARLVRERARIAGELLAALERRRTALEDLRVLVRERDALLARARSTLLPDGATADDDESRMLDRLAIDARERWVAIDALLALAGALPQASASRERAAAAERLGVETDALVLAEATLLELQLATVTDPFSAPEEARLAGRVAEWRAALDAIEPFRGRWTTWVEAWERLRQDELSSFQALRRVADGLAALRVDRLEAAARAWSAAGSDEIGAFLRAARELASREAAGARQGRARLAAARGDLESDPLLAAMARGGSDGAWSEAAEGARGWIALEREIGLIGSAARAALDAREARRPVADRLAALLAVSEGLGVPWTLRREAGRIVAAAIVAGQGFVIEGLDGPGPARLRSAGARSAGGSPGDPRAWPDRLVGAVLWLVAPRAAEAEPYGATTRELAQDVILSTGEGVRKEVEQNLFTYGVMIAGGTCLGLVCGGPPGALAGAKAASMAAIGSAGKDIFRGAVKGVSTLTMNPAVIKAAEVSMDVYNVYDATRGLANVHRVGLVPETQAYRDHAGNFAKASSRIRELEARIQGVSALEPDAVAAGRQLRKFATRLDRAVRGMRANGVGRGVLWGSRLADAADNLDDTVAAAPENLRGLRAAFYADGLRRASLSADGLVGLRGAVSAAEEHARQEAAVAAADVTSATELLSEMQRQGREAIKASVACEDAEALRSEIEAAVGKIEQQAARVSLGVAQAQASVSGCRTADEVRQGVRTYGLARQLHAVTRSEAARIRDLETRWLALSEQGALGARPRADVQRLLATIRHHAARAREAARRARAEAERGLASWTRIQERKPIVVAEIERLRSTQPDGLDAGPRLDVLLARLVFAEPALAASVGEADTHAVQAHRLLQNAEAVAAHVGGLLSCDAGASVQGLLARADAALQPLGADDLDPALLQSANACLARLRPPPPPPPPPPGNAPEGALAAAERAVTQDASSVERQKELHRQREAERQKELERQKERERQTQLAREAERVKRLEQERQAELERQRRETEAQIARDRRRAAEAQREAAEREQQAAEASAMTGSVMSGLVSALAAAAAAGHQGGTVAPAPSPTPAPAPWTRRAAPDRAAVAAAPSRPAPAPRPAAPPPPREQGPYFIMLLTNASNGLYIGSEASLANRTRCSFSGGGNGCRPSDTVAYRKLAGPFAQQADARAALCRNVTARKVWALGIGLKGQWQGSETWYGLWDGSVSFDCARR
jgi:hypothetical protein